METTTAYSVQISGMPAADWIGSTTDDGRYDQRANYSTRELALAAIERVREFNQRAVFTIVECEIPAARVTR